MDYSQHSSWYYRRQGSYCELRADLGPEPLNTFAFTSSDSHGRRYPAVDAHRVGGPDEYEPRPRWYSHYNHGLQPPLSPNHNCSHQAEPGRATWHQTPGGQPWPGSWIESPGYFDQSAHWRPRTQYHPRPRSARFRCSNLSVSETEAQNCWSNAHGSGRHVQFGLGALPQAERWPSHANTTPRSQGDDDHGDYQERGANERYISPHDLNLQADHRPGLWPTYHNSRRSYRQSSPAHIRKDVLDPTYDSRANTTGQVRSNTDHGISDKNHRAPAAELSLRAEMITNPAQQRPYRKPSSNPCINRSISGQNIPPCLHNVSASCAENNPPRTPPSRQHPFGFERANQRYPRRPLSPSNNTAAPQPSGKPSSTQYHGGSRFVSFYLRDSFDQPRRVSESSDDIDLGQGCSVTQHSGEKEKSAYHNLPHRTRNTSKQVRQELHRCALAAAALQLERSKLRREWEKLCREQETLLQAQRRLRHGWQHFTEKQQQHLYCNESESMNSCHENESSSESDYAEPSVRKPQQFRAEDLGTGRPMPSTTSEQTSHDPRMLLDKYNQQWNTLFNGTSTDIPWPTTDLKPATLSKPHLRTPRSLLNSANPQNLLKWNAFSFFTAAFEVRPTIKQAVNGIVMNIGATSLEVDKAIRNQAREDIKRWHQDKLGCRGVELASDERAKAVFAAVYELYGICSERIRTSS